MLLLAALAPALVAAGGKPTPVIGGDGIRAGEQTWAWEDIQRLTLAPGKIRITTYQDNKWKLGRDRAYTFKGDFIAAYPTLAARLDRRLVAEFADLTVRPLWQLPVKRRGTIAGTEGALIFGEDRIVYKTNLKGSSRTWRYADIDNIATSGPYDLTLITFEPKAYNFQLKAPLDEGKYNELWRKLNLRRDQ